MPHMTILNVNQWQTNDEKIHQPKKNSLNLNFSKRQNMFVVFFTTASESSNDCLFVGSNQNG